MKSLKSPEKKLIFKILIHLSIFIIIGFSIVAVVKAMNDREDYYKDSKDSIIAEYNIKIREKDSINNVLINKQINLEIKIDSLNKVKGNITNTYDAKIKNIYDASAIQHAMWMDSTLQKLSYPRR